MLNTTTKEAVRTRIGNALSAIATLKSILNEAMKDEDYLSLNVLAHQILSGTSPTQRTTYSATYCPNLKRARKESRTITGANGLTRHSPKRRYCMSYRRLPHRSTAKSHSKPRISLKTGAFISEKEKEIRLFSEVYCDMLQDIFTEVTGYDTQIPRIIGINC